MQRESCWNDGQCQGMLCRRYVLYYSWVQCKQLVGEHPNVPACHLTQEVAAIECRRQRRLWNVRATGYTVHYMLRELGDRLSRTQRRVIIGMDEAPS